MANSYWMQTYGAFIKEHEQAVLKEKENKYLNEYTIKWNAAVEKLRKSGVDLSQIRITKGDR